jgi:hypothetical protein
MTNKGKNRLYYEKNKDKILIQRKQKREKEKSSKCEIDVQIPDQLTSDLFRQKSCEIIKLGSRRDFGLRLVQSGVQSDGQSGVQSDGQQRAASERPYLLIPFLVLILGAIICEMIYLQYQFMAQNGAPGLANFAIAVTIELIPIALMFCKSNSWTMNLISKGIALACVILTLGVTSISVLDQTKSKISGIALKKKQLEIDRVAVEEQQRASTQARELEMRGLSEEIESQQALLESAIKDKAWGVMKVASTNIANTNMRISELRKTLQIQPEISKKPALLYGDEKLTEMSGWVLVGIRAILLVSSLFFASYLSRGREWLRSGDKRWLESGHKVP